MLRAIEQIRRMRGGAQSHLMRCSDGKEHRHLLCREIPEQSAALPRPGQRTARQPYCGRMGLPVPRVEIVKVEPDLIRLTPALCIEMPRSSTPCCPGLQFGSAHPGDPRRMTLHDFLPDEQLREVKTSTILPACWSSTNGHVTPMAARHCSFARVKTGPVLTSPGGNETADGRGRLRRHRVALRVWPRALFDRDDRSGLLLQRRRMELSRCAPCAACTPATAFTKA